MTALLVARLWLVYLSAAVLSLFLARRFVAPVRRAAAAVLVLLPLLFVGRAMVTAGVYAPLAIAYDVPPLAASRNAFDFGPPRNGILSDVVYQMIPWQKAVREAVKHGRLPLWNRFLRAGEPLLAVQQHGALHPAFWLGCMLPLAQAWTLGLTLRLFLAAFAGYLFFRELGCRESASLLGGAAWTLSDFLVFFLGYPLNPAIGVLPLLLLGLRRLARTPGRNAVGVTLAALLLMLVAGHPESVLHGCGGAGIFFVFELAAVDAKQRVRAIGLAFMAGALALGLSAVILLPFREALVRTVEYTIRANWYAKADRSVPFPTSLARSAKNLVPFAFGAWQFGAGEDPAFAGPAGYAGSVIVPLAVVGALSKRRERWTFFLMGFLGAAAWARLPIVNDAICRLPLFDVSINEYLASLAALAVVTLAVIGADRIVAGDDGVLLAAVCAASATAIFCLQRAFIPSLGGAAPGLVNRLALFQLVPIALLGIAVPVTPRNRRSVLAAVLPLVLLLASRRLEIGSLYPTAPSRAFYPELPIFRTIPRDSPWRFASVGFTFIPNVAALYELEDVRGYEAMTLAPFAETFPLWCKPQAVWFNRVDDPTKPFLAFLNVRYVLGPPGHPLPAGWKLLAEDAGGRLFENPNALPRAFVPRRVFSESEPGRQRERLFAIQDFGEEGVVEAAGSSIADNGAAAVRIASYAPQRMEMSIDAEAPALVATSVTRWPGWRLELDGREVPLLAYNRAFLAFRVPAGRHRAVLRYLPRSFVAGAWISAISLVAALAIFLVPRRGPAAASATSAATGANARAADQAIHDRGSGTGSR